MNELDTDDWPDVPDPYEILTGASPELLFPPSPIAGSSRLRPLTSWYALHREQKVTGCDFSAFWLDSVKFGVAYFFAWLGEHRCTVLVCWSGKRLSHIECREDCDQELLPSESAPIYDEVARLFRTAAPGVEEREAWPIH